MKFPVCGLLLLSSAAIAGTIEDSNAEAMDAVSSFEKSLYEGVKSYDKSFNDLANKTVSSDKESLVLPCGEPTKYRLVFVSSSFNKGWRNIGFVPAEFEGKAIYCKKTGLIFPDGTAVNDYQLGSAYFSTVYLKNSEAKIDEYLPNKYSPNNEVTDPELKKLLSDYDRKAKEKAEAQVADYGKKIRIESGNMITEGN
ncbi:hypothetical protein [Pantoea sp. CFSAN033090]|uniref:hypothetical protein n=1 Tax=Pantoea sp. CFSAN033090 TaxID=1690502 RepID=UPI000A6CD23E|nr:hypothetical protein [Pantoea sp. CFSAN033090]